MVYLHRIKAMGLLNRFAHFIRELRQTTGCSSISIHCRTCTIANNCKYTFFSINCSKNLVYLCGSVAHNAKSAPPEWNNLEASLYR